MQQPQAHLDHHSGLIEVAFPNGRKLIIQKHDFHISHFSQGPGGQNVNKHMSGVQLIYAIPEAFRRPEKKTRQIVVRAHHQRSQEHNMRQALKELRGALENYFYIQPPRLPTRMGKYIKYRRHQEKKRQSMKKSLRSGSLENQ